ncbi:MAG: hypothetical protein AABZ30_04900 [Myxococcota bacterium]|mgnify:CR=1 FL=1
MVRLRVRFPSESFEAFVLTYAADLARGHVVLRTAKPLALGTKVRFALVILTGEEILAGTGHVLASRPPEAGGKTGGMIVQFRDLTPASRARLDEILAWKKAPRTGGLHDPADPLVAPAGETPVREAPAAEPPYAHPAAAAPPAPVERASAEPPRVGDQEERAWEVSLPEPDEEVAPPTEPEPMLAPATQAEPAATPAPLLSAAVAQGRGRPARRWLIAAGIALVALAAVAILWRGRSEPSPVVFIEERPPVPSASVPALAPPVALDTAPTPTVPPPPAPSMVAKPDPVVPRAPAAAPAPSQAKLSAASARPSRREKAAVAAAPMPPKDQPAATPKRRKPTRESTAPPPPQQQQSPEELLDFYRGR